MLYFCLKHKKIMKGLGLRTHFHWKHKKEAKNLERVRRKDLAPRSFSVFGNICDYFNGEKLMAVCLDDRDVSVYRINKEIKPEKTRFVNILISSLKKKRIEYLKKEG